MKEEKRATTKRTRTKDKTGEEEKNEATIRFLRERTKLRTEYRGLINEVGESREEMIQPGSAALRDAIGRGDELFEQVSNPREAALDSEFLAICSQFAAEQANRLSTQMRTYDVPSYIHRLGLFLRGKLTINDAGLAEGPDEDETALRRNRERRRGDEENGEAEEGEEDIDDDAQLLRWPELGALVAGFAQSTPSLDCLAGAMVATPKEKKVRAQRAKKEKPGEKVEPESITDTKALEMEGQTAKRVAIAKKKLEQAKVKNFFEYIVDPESYSQTVENLFHLSFLVRNGMAAVDLDEAGQPALEPKSPPDDDDYAQGLEKKQCVVRLDYDMYQNLIKAYDIQRSFLPHRTKSYSQSATQSSQRDGASSRSGKRKGRRGSDEDDEEEEEEEEVRRPPAKRASTAASKRGKGKQKVTSEEEDDEEEEEEPTRHAPKRRR